MSERERLRREDPARTGPIRNWSTLYRGSSSWNRDEPPPGDQTGAGGAAYSDVVAHGVELGYRVIQEQICQGQRIAEDLGKGSYDANAMAGDYREVADRAWRYFTDLGSLWLDYVFALTAGNGDLARQLAELWQAPRPSAAASTDGVSIAVSCARPTRATLNLRPQSAPMTLACQPLGALHGGAPPLSDVAFERTADGVSTLHVRVADTQPPGTYVGVVFDSQTSEARGTLSVTVS